MGGARQENAVLVTSPVVVFFAFKTLSFSNKDFKKKKNPHQLSPCITLKQMTFKLKSLQAGRAGF